MIRLNLGSGILLLKDYINVDMAFSYDDLKNGMGKKNNIYKDAVIQEEAKFVQASILKLPFKDNYADVAEMHQVVEHFRIRDVIPAFKEVYRVLKKGGKLILTTPNFNALCLEWINMITHPSNGFNIDLWTLKAEEFYGNQANDAETHRCPMTPEFLIYSLNHAGFHDTIGKVVIFPLYGELPQKGYGLVSKYIRDNKMPYKFRTETIYMEVIK